MYPLWNNIYPVIIQFLFLIMSVNDSTGVKLISYNIWLWYKIIIKIYYGGMSTYIHIVFLSL